MEQFYVVLLVYINLAYAEEIYQERADDLFESIIGNKVYKVSHKYAIPSPLTTVSFKTTKNDIIRNYYNNNEDINLMRAPDNKTINKLMEDLREKRHEKYIKELLDRRVNPIPDFESDIDEIALVTRRFDNIRAKRMQFPVPEPETRRNFTGESRRTRREDLAEKILTIMLQFIYETRYRLPYAQLLRKKYKSNLRYKIGYCLSLLRSLKQQQMVLYSALKNYVKKMTTLFYHLSIYQKILRLDVDIKDLIKFIKSLEEERRLIEDTTPIDEMTEATTKTGFTFPLFGFMPPGGPRRFGAGGNISTTSMPSTRSRRRPSTFKRNRKLWAPFGKFTHSI